MASNMRDDSYDKFEYILYKPPDESDISLLAANLDITVR